MKRIILAAILGGLVVFIWGAISHMVTPLGGMGLSTITNEGPVLDAMRANIPKSGLYFFPGMEMGKEPTPEWDAKFKRGPSGLLAIAAGPGQDKFPQQLACELGTNIIAAYIAAVIAAMMVGTMVRRALAIGLLAIFATVSLTFSYGIWYGFPAMYVLGEVIGETVGWLLAGFAIAKIVPPPAAAS